MPRTGVLIMGFGGPYSLDDVEPFCRNLMGREPSAEVLERVKRRYLVIGGRSPLPGIAKSIAEQLEKRFSESADEAEVPVVYGMRYWHPFIADGVAALAESGVERIVAVSLSPFESAHSSGAYREAVNEAASRYGIEVVEAPSFRRTAPYLGFLSGALLDTMDAIEATRTGVLFTAHSLPVAEIAGDPYVQQLRETVNGVAAQTGLMLPMGETMQRWLPGIEAYGAGDTGTPWLLTYQSKGARPGEWLQPDVMDCVREMASAGFDGVIFAPIGFATDHMETLYDLDVEACGLALDLDMDYQRAAVPNDGPQMIEALAEVVGPLL